MYSLRVGYPHVVVRRTFSKIGRASHERIVQPVGVGGAHLDPGGQPAAVRSRTNKAGSSVDEMPSLKVIPSCGHVSGGAQ